jgi:integral membrane protein (TIGR01906 family)
MLLTAIISVAGLIRNIRYKNFHFLKLAAIALVAFTIVPLVAFAVDFNTAFIVFHEIFFTNDYWIFDPRTDPVITILPETFFLHAALLILGLILLAVIGLTRAYRRLSRKNSAVGRASR